MIYAVLGAIAVGLSLGIFVGKALNDRINQRALKRGFAIFLLAMAAFIAVQETASLLANDSETRTDASIRDGTASGASSAMLGARNIGTFFS